MPRETSSNPEESTLALTNEASSAETATTASVAVSEVQEPQEPGDGIPLYSITPGSLPVDAPQLHPNHHDIYYWRAIYDDGTYLLEVDGDDMHGFSEIDQKRLRGFVLHPVLEGYPQYGVEIDGDKRLVFTRRRTTTYNPNDGSASWFVWHIMGYQVTVDGKNSKSLLFISMAGDAFLTDNPNPELP